MPQNQNRMQVQFLGETFTVKGAATKDEIKKTSDYLNQQLDYLHKRCPLLTQKNLAILTAFNLADELLRVKRDYEELVAILDKQ